MTVAGFNILPGARQALAWTDSETFIDGEPSSHMSKLAVNPLTTTIAVGTGRAALLVETAILLGKCLTFDEAVARLPGHLLDVASHVERDAAARSSATFHIAALVGFSHKRRHLAGVTFDSRNGFVALPARQWFAPRPPDVDAPDDLHGVVATSQAQLEILRRQTPAATGVLVMAEIGPGGISCRPVFDFGRGALLDRPADLSEAGVARRPVQQARPVESVHDRENPDRRQRVLHLGRVAGTLLTAGSSA
jgi:hypothetical protein